MPENRLNEKRKEKEDWRNVIEDEVKRTKEKE